MQPDVADKMMVVMLDDMVHHTLPRIYAIDKNLRRGDVLSATEVDFFVHHLQTIDQCFRLYQHDPQCRVIFSSMAHLCCRVVKRAWKNQQRLDATAES